MIQRLTAGACLAALAVLGAGCATTEPARRPVPGPPLPPADVARAPPAPAAPPPPASAPDESASLGLSGTVNASLPPQPLPQLINTVFGDILRIPYAVGPDVAGRTDIVALRGANGMSRRDFFRMVQLALKAYGLRTYVQGGVVNVVADTVANGPPPVVLRPRPDPVQADATETSQLFEAKVIQVDALMALMTDVFPQARNVAFTADEASNSLVASGRPRDVGAAMAVMRQLDQPQFSGAGVFKVQPVYWSPDSLARSLEDALRAEGYRVAGDPGAPRSVLVMPFAGAGQLLVFSRDPALLQRARYWIDRLDQPATMGGGVNTFIYQVQNIDAKSLAGLVSGGEGNAPAPAAVGAPGAPGAAPANTASNGDTFRGGRVVVDPTGNRILFTGTAEDFAQLRGLLVALDAPLKEVLVEVTIAEVTLNDETQLGLEWFFQHSFAGGVLSGGTQGGLGLGSQGLNLKYAGKTLEAAFNTFASNNNVNILSRPRLVARSGSEAHIQVGTDVPIITSQINSPTSTAGSTDILQTIQYRQTGIILHIKPVVFGEDQVNLEITQEVSSEQNNPNAAIGSPLILNRNVTTELSLAEGTTAVLGGLIDTSYTKGNSGVPLLKDIPVLGQAFRTDTVSGAKTELIMLVTPHILRDSGEMSRWAALYSSEMNDAFRVGRGWSHTLTPYDARKDLVVQPGKVPAP